MTDGGGDTGSLACVSRIGHVVPMTSDVANPQSGLVLTGFSHLSLSVTDLDRTLSFYRDVLGAAQLVATTAHRWMS